VVAMDGVIEAEPVSVKTVTARWVGCQCSVFEIKTGGQVSTLFRLFIGEAKARAKVQAERMTCGSILIN
jgi:hypothetical protein